MANQQNPVLVGVFQNRTQAQQAFDELRQAGFGFDYLGFSEPDKKHTGLSKSLISIGMPEEEARFYEREYAQGHTIVTVRTQGLHEDSIQKAQVILNNHGAQDTNPKTPDGSYGYKPEVGPERESPYFDLHPKTRLPNE
jgi:hypothetical protein